jgi:predicted TIM-barrel fold metal-dependent hydrolase
MTSPAVQTSRPKLNAKYRVVDADGHVLEPPTGLWERAPAEFKDRMFRVVRDDEGKEWVHYDGAVSRATAIAGTAGMSVEEQTRAFRGDLQYSDMVPGSYEPEPRIPVLDTDGIDQSVLYPTRLLDIARLADHAFAAAVSRAYNDWLVDYCRYAPDRLFGIAMVPQQDIELAVAEIHRAKGLGMVGVFARPNPSVGERKLLDPVYDPLWRACAEADLPLGLHPFLAPDMPGACRALGINEIKGGDVIAQTAMGNIFFTQAISNPFDMMLSLTYLIAGGVLERHPNLRVLLLEANGGWIVPWLERLDHHHEIFGRDVPAMKMKPSEYFKRQCWISFDADESTLAMTAESPLVGADRIIWASDYPHPDAKYPGVTEELDEACERLSEAQRARIFGLNAAELYKLPAPRR